MNFKITHSTTYRYSTPVSVCHNMVTLTPRVTDQLQVSRHQLLIHPTPPKSVTREDMFRNVITRFSLEQNHSKLTVKAVSHVSVTPRPLPALSDCLSCREVTNGIADRTDPDWLNVSLFLFDSPRILRQPVFADFAKRCMTDAKPILQAASELTNLIFTEFKYDKDATQVDTPTRTAFDGRHGVCQDFAHVAVACLRSVGLPARYVSGYLRTHPPVGSPRLVGADESHAWLSVYCGSNLGWVDFDPTNNCVADGDHIPIAVGRDYSDVVPIKGVFLGGGDPQLSVSVDVAPV